MTSAQAGIVLQHIRRLAGKHRGAQPTDRQLLEHFTAQREEAAFATLVRRHGPMVLNVCRGVLHHEQDAEDAFQATFLMLARKADTISQPAAVAGWLYEVAYRVAVKAQADTARRRAQERRVSPMAPVDPTLDMTLRDLRRVLHEELRRLADKYRLPLVLCYLEGRSHEEAAGQLGWTKGTFRGRLDRGREVLRRRLAARGVALSALLGATAVAPRVAAAALVASVVRVAALSAVDGAASGLLSAKVCALAEGVSRAMFASKLKVIAAMLLALGLVASGASVLAYQAFATTERPEGSQRSAVGGQKSEVGSRKPGAGAAKPQAAEEKDTALVSGRVVDPDGKPFPAAKIFFARYILRDPPPQPPAVVTSDAEGRFRLRVSRTGYPEKHMKDQWMHGAVVAVGEEFAFGWAGGDAEKLTNVTVKLSKEVPIQGRVVDLQGKPMAEVKVQPRSVMFRADGGDLKDFMAGLTKERPNRPDHRYMRLNPASLSLTRPVVTGADGKFRLTGICGECVVGLRLEGPTIEAVVVNAMTRPASTIVTPRYKDRPDLGKAVYHGNIFDHVAAPTQPIEGTVRDRDTGKPLAGVTIQAHFSSAHFVGDPTVDAATDEHGRYRLVGLSREAGHRLLAVPLDGQPYLRAELTSGAATGLDPVTLDFTLKRGVLIRGRVTNKETGRPVAALVTYFALDDNRYLREAPGYRNSHSIEVRTGEDGSFTVLGLPGRGLVAAKAADNEREGPYLIGVGAEKIEGSQDDNFVTHPTICDTRHYHTLLEVNPAKDAESIVRDVVLDPGKTVTGTIVGPDGQPVRGVRIATVYGIHFGIEDLPTAQFRLPGIDPKRPRSFEFRHSAKNLGAIVLIKGDESMPVKVRLQNCATITGRIVDEEGLPRASWIGGYIHQGQLDINNDTVGIGIERTGKDGRFRIEGVIPGLKIGFWAGSSPSYYDQHLVPELTLKPGEVRDLGDLTRKIME